VLRYGEQRVIRPLVEREQLAQLRMLSLIECKGSSELLKSPHLANLDDVLVYNHDEDIARALADGRIRPKQTEYNADSIDHDGLETLVDADYFCRIEELHLAAVDDDAIQTLCSRPMRHLRSLEMSGSFGERGLAALGARLEQLESLRIDGRFDEAIAEVMIAHMTSGRLRRLECTRPFETGMAAFVRSSAMRGVERLTTSALSLDVEVLERSKHRTALRTLVIERVPAGFVLDGVEIVID
jgi:hypothetical protein